MSQKIGISSIGYYFPRYYVSLPKLLKSRSEDPKKATEGLGVNRMTIAASNEDSISMGANAIEALNYRKEDIGKLIFATECGVDSAKDNAAYVHSLCDLPKDCEAYDVKAACAAGTYALWQVVDWILSKRNKGKSGIVVCSDKAVYDHYTGAEITGGSGSIALLIQENPSIISFNFSTGNYKRSVRDFWKPLGKKHAIVNGKVSLQAYLEALQSSYISYLQNGGDSRFDYLIFHTPFKKMVQKAFKRLSKILPKIGNKFNSMTQSSLIPSINWEYL